MNNIYKQTAFVVISCDKYSDLWEGFEKSIDKFWPNCPFDKYIITNFKRINSKSIKTINIGEDETWSISLKKALDTLKDKYKYSIITLEDLFLIDSVNNESLYEILKYAIINDAKYLRLHRNMHKKNNSKQMYEHIKNNELYRFNCTYAFWNINFLCSLLNDNENAWEFEYNSPSRAKHEEKIYMVSEPIFKYSNTVIKGKWVPSEAELIKNLIPDYQISREMMTTKESLKIKRNEKLFKFITNNFHRGLLNCIVKSKRKMFK
jgi:hypothetical protein